MTSHHLILFAMKWSLRAQNILTKTQFSLPEIPSDWQKCHSNDGRVVAWKGRENFEEWGYQGPWTEGERVILEAMGHLLKNKSWQKIKEITLREAEAWLRDRNSEPAFSPEEMGILPQMWGQLQAQIEHSFKSGRVLSDFRFPSEKSFEKLNLSEKIRELKAFFSSERLSGFYKNGGEIELLDVEEFTLYIALNCGTIPEGALLDWLQMSLAETFREPRLNLVPEPFSH